MTRQDWPVIDASDRMDIHCKAYIQQSLDRAIKKFQTETITESGDNITYSEAVRRLLLVGLSSIYGGINFRNEH